MNPTSDDDVGTFGVPTEKTLSLNPSGDFACMQGKAGIEYRFRRL
jgi:hypothetical protein